MLLRGVTTFFLVLGLFLAFAFPWVVGPKPHSHAELGPYSVKFGIYVLALLACFIAACICALLLVRRAREAYREESRRNLEFLIESSLRTHQKKPDHQSAQGTPLSDEHDT